MGGLLLDAWAVAWCKSKPLCSGLWAGWADPWDASVISWGIFTVPWDVSNRSVACFVRRMQMVFFQIANRRGQNATDGSLLLCPAAVGGGLRSALSALFRSEGHVAIFWKIAPRAPSRGAVAGSPAPPRAPPVAVLRRGLPVACAVF